MFTLYVKDVWIGLNMSKSNVGKKEGTRLSLKCSAWKGFINFALRKFRSEKNFVSEIFFQKTIWFRKVLV